MHDAWNDDADDDGAEAKVVVAVVIDEEDIGRRVARASGLCVTAPARWVQDAEDDEDDACIVVFVVGGDELEGEAVVVTVAAVGVVYEENWMMRSKGRKDRPLYTAPRSELVTSPSPKDPKVQKRDPICDSQENEIG
ncbi:hypothetical protein ONZ45_g9953 [Pleurotus djamor]|nr:hypothetical protein ONZ45_g9953 [Pleurotus djamor]